MVIACYSLPKTQKDAGESIPCAGAFRPVKATKPREAQVPQTAFSGISGDKNRDVIISMGDLQDPIDGGTLVPYFWPYFCWDISLHTPDIEALYMESVPSI